MANTVRVFRIGKKEDGSPGNITAGLDFPVVSRQQTPTGGQQGIPIQCFAMKAYMGILDRSFSYSVVFWETFSYKDKIAFIGKRFV